MNGAAARRCQVGDRIIIATYGQFNVQESAQYKPKLVYLNQDNSVERSTHTIPIQLANSS
jgi:aspartate 1-decarboxylase